MKTTRRLALVAVNAILVVCATVASASAQSRCAPRQVTPVELRSLDLESLLNVKVVTASKFAESQSDAPGIMSVVSQDELRRFGGTTLREVLERVPGLASSTAYFTDRSMVAARGDQTKINGGHVLFLINGRPTREVLEGGLVSDLLESFPINVLERIEVIKGPGSVLYGSNAFSAVVNLITLEDRANGFSFGGTDEYGVKAVEGRMHTNDLHATLLALLGLDHEKLTYSYAGRDFRLTDVAGKVNTAIFA
jgi:outer membrane receptor for ferrienterochelin and colicin